MAAGKNVKRRREELGLTQWRLAIAADVTVTTVSRIEREVVAPDIATLEALAGPLQTTLTDLLTDPEAAQVGVGEADARPVQGGGPSGASATPPQSPSRRSA